MGISYELERLDVMTEEFRSLNHSISLDELLGEMKGQRWYVIAEEFRIIKRLDDITVTIYCDQQLIEMAVLFNDGKLNDMQDRMKKLYEKKTERIDYLLRYYDRHYETRYKHKNK